MMASALMASLVRLYSLVVRGDSPKVLFRGWLGNLLRVLNGTTVLQVSGDASSPEGMTAVVFSERRYQGYRKERTVL
jgi:hypothetical protein